jgi:hypothetical protein
MSAAIFPDPCHLHKDLHLYISCSKALRTMSKRATVLLWISNSHGLAPLASQKFEEFQTGSLRDETSR